MTYEDVLRRAAPSPPRRPTPMRRAACSRPCEPLLLCLLYCTVTSQSIQGTLTSLFNFTQLYGLVCYCSAGQTPKLSSCAVPTFDEFQSQQLLFPTSAATWRMQMLIDANNCVNKSEKLYSVCSISCLHYRRLAILSIGTAF